jgi:hypothetical protein
MHPTHRYDLMQARMAGLHREAQHDALASAARQAHRARRRHPAPARAGFPAVRRAVRTVLGARST